MARNGLVKSISALLVVLGLAVGGASAHTAVDNADADKARALVAARRDVPAGWGDPGSAIPCLARRTGVPLRARATSSFTGLGGHLWSVALVAPTRAQARTLFARVGAQVPACLARWWKKDSPSAVRVQSEPRGPSLGEESRRWVIGTLHVVAVRTGHSVAYFPYVLSGPFGPQVEEAIRRAVERG